jgi:hypothetical protein
MCFKLVPTHNSPIITYFQITSYFCVLRFSDSVSVLNWSGIIRIFQTGLGQRGLRYKVQYLHLIQNVMFPTYRYNSLLLN